jgi:hypothetical protein
MSRSPNAAKREAGQVRNGMGPISQDLATNFVRRESKQNTSKVYSVCKTALMKVTT